MNNKLEQELFKAATSTFEEFCFMFPAPEMEGELEDIEFGKAALVHFQGPFKGKLIVKASENLMTTIAENMLGEDLLTEKQRNDALGEVGNVICGNVLPGLAGAKAVFNIDSPQIVTIEELADIQPTKNTIAVKLPLDEGLVDLKIIIDDDIEL